MYGNGRKPDVGHGQTYVPMSMGELFAELTRRKRERDMPDKSRTSPAPYRPGSWRCFCSMWVRGRG